MMNELPAFISGLESADWANREFEQSPLVDARLTQRLVSIATDFACQPAASLPQACRTKAKTKGAYRFVENEFVDPQQILAGHLRSTFNRLAGQTLILSPQDTTSLRYHRPGTQGIGSIKGKGKGSRGNGQGLWLHSTHTYGAEGLPLGLVQAHFWSRHPQPKHNRRHTLPIEQKESVRWLRSWQICQDLLQQLPQPVCWINIADMEADIYEVFAHALAQPAPRVEVLIRSRHNRCLEASDQKLWERLTRQPVAATMPVAVSRQRGRPARVAQVEVRFMAVRLPAPCHKEGQAPLDLWAVEAREVNTPAGQEPIHWRLLTTLPVTCAQEAIQLVQWYATRWRIEVFHKILKSACKVEDRQLDTAWRLQRVLAIDLVVAWRIQALTQAGRETPELPADVCFEASEWRALSCYIQRTAQPPTQPPTLGEMAEWIGQLGGFVKSKANPYAGPITLARGLARLSDLTAMWEIQNANKTNQEVS